MFFNVLYEKHSPDYWNACYPKCAAYINIAFYYATNSWKHRLCQKHVFLRACSLDTGCLRRAAWKAACDLLLCLSLTPWSEIYASDSLVWDLCLWLPGLRSVSLTPWSEICASDSLVWDLCLWLPGLRSVSLTPWSEICASDSLVWDLCLWLPGLRSVPLSCMFVLPQAGGSTGLLMDLAASEKAVHADFFNGKDSCAFFTACCALPSNSGVWTLHWHVEFPQCSVLSETNAHNSYYPFIIIREIIWFFLIHKCSLMTTDNEIRKG